MTLAEGGAASLSSTWLLARKGDNTALGYSNAGRQQFQRAVPGSYRLPRPLPPKAATQTSMATRLAFENSADVGVFATLTNKYALCCMGGSQNFFSVLESELVDHIPVVRCSIAGVRIIGRMSVGNSKGLLLPSTCTDQEHLHIRNSLPDGVVVQRVEERLSALGNVIACNDYVALVHPDLDRETEEIIADTLGVEVLCLACSLLAAALC